MMKVLSNSSIKLASGVAAVLRHLSVGRNAHTRFPHLSPALVAIPAADAILGASLSPPRTYTICIPLRPLARVGHGGRLLLCVT